ncbi:hypothetical protein ABPG72_013783 [Tetrahymena utriculariae]
MKNYSTLSEYRNANSNLTLTKNQQEDKNLRNSKVDGSQLSSVQNLDINNNNNMISENTIKNKKRFKLEEQKELRIQEFLAARRKEYEKYITLDFDYRIVDQELRRLKPVDYSDIDKDEERRRMRDNRLNIIKDRQNLFQNLSKDSYDMNGGEDTNYVQQLIQQMKVYITMLQDNFIQSDENFKNIPASYRDDHFLLGPPKFCGSALRKINDKCMNEEIWIVIRGFYLFVYPNQESQRPICMLRIPLNKICLEVANGFDIKENGYKQAQEFQYFSLVERASQQIHFYLGKKQEDLRHLKTPLYEFLKKQIAIKAYFFLCGYLNATPDQSLISFFDNDESTILKINLDTEKLDNTCKVYPVLKPVSEAFFYYTLMIASTSRNLIEIDFSDLCLWSQFITFFFSVMKDDSVSCQLRVLKLDNNDITDEVLLAMLDYFKKPQSFFVTHLSMNRIEDLQQTSFMYIGRIISERHYAIREYIQKQAEHYQGQVDYYQIQAEYQLPFQYLSLNYINMNDTGLSNLVINLEKVHNDNSKRGIYDYDQYLELHIAHNELSQTSLRSLGNLLEAFQGISVLNISENIKIESVSQEYFFNCLKSNYSLTTLNISRIEINSESFKSLISLLEENFTLQAIQITLTETMVFELSKTKNMNLLKYFMISYNPQQVFENI